MFKFFCELREVVPTLRQVNLKLAKQNELIQLQNEMLYQLLRRNSDLASRVETQRLADFNERIG